MKKQIVVLMSTLIFLWVGLSFLGSNQTNALAFLNIQKPSTANKAYAGSFDHPHKIIIVTDKPTDGLSVTDISVTVGGLNATVTTLYEASETYVIEALPPMQTADGIYDLSVTAGSATGSAAQAVQYASVNNIDVVSVIDRSGSMGTTDMAAAKNAAKQFVDFMQLGDQIGIVSFSSDVTVNYPLTLITSGGSSVIFTDDMESGAGNWTAATPWALITDTYHSATTAWNVNPTGTNVGTISTTLTSKSINLSAVAKPYLSFWVNSYFSSLDDLFVELSNDNGATWSTAIEYEDTDDVWQEKLVDMSSVAGQSSVQVRFLYDGNLASYDDVYIDDVTVLDGLDTQTAIKVAIDQISSGGTTSIGGGLQAGQGELTSSGDPLHPQALILLTDGFENTSPYAADVLPAIKSAGTVVHTIGLGTPTSVDVPLLQNIAAETGGTFNLAPTSAELAGIYNTIAGAVTGQQILFSFQGIAPGGSTVTEMVPVDSTVSDVTFSVSWSGSSPLNLTLEDPGGNPIDQTDAAADPDIQFVTGQGYQYYRVKTPMAGIWKMLITNSTLAALHSPSADISYTAIAFGQTNLTMNVYTSQTFPKPGEDLEIAATLADDQPILGATVQAVVELPDPTAVSRNTPNWAETPNMTINATAATTMTLSLTDPDNDGVYVGVIPGSQVITGTHIFDVTASGISNSSPPLAFTRQTQLLVKAVNLNYKIHLPVVITE
ncbi:MAG: VWA domain-containing protein [Chloroflexi bacterium]|nr:VWA domain-containing protein [Chloroflexota bacterium]